MAGKIEAAEDAVLLIRLVAREPEYTSAIGKAHDVALKSAVRSIGIAPVYWGEIAVAKRRLDLAIRAAGVIEVGWRGVAVTMATLAFLLGVDILRLSA